MKFRFKRKWDEADGASETVAGETRLRDRVTAKADGTDLGFQGRALPKFRQKTQRKVPVVASQPGHFKGAGSATGQCNEKAHS